MIDLSHILVLAQEAFLRRQISTLIAPEPRRR